jgi:CRP-like cAMP-binding protein
MVVLGDDRSPHETMVQVSGEAMRLPAADLRHAMDASPTLRNLLLRYSQAFMIQTSHTALANGRAKLEERLARWLLMAHDRIDGDELPLVHEFLAVMLGVRRAGVTVALHILEGQALIGARRGKIIVLDRQGLEEAANGIYGVPEREYERLMAA